MAQITDLSYENKNIFNFEDMICRALKYEKENGQQPKIVYVDARKKDYVTFERFREMFGRYVDFIQKNNRLPRFITINPAAPPLTPASCCDTGFFVQDYQDTGYSCGASSLKMALSAMGITVTEQEVMRVAGTTSYGTTHDGMVKAANHFGVSAWFINFSDTGWDAICRHIRDGGEIILHIMTHKLQADCKGNVAWRGAYGHYIYLTKVCQADKVVWVADPTKGLRCHTFSQMEQAMAAVTWAPSVLFLRKATRAIEDQLTINRKAEMGPNSVIGEQGLSEAVINDYIKVVGVKGDDKILAKRLFEEGRLKKAEAEGVVGKMDIITVDNEVFIDPELVIARLEER